MPLQLCILMIDDDADDQEIFSMAIEKVIPSAKCEFANDGVHALQKLKSPDPHLVPDLIFIDMNMPRMDGIECLTEIKKLEHLSNIPTYMYSTSDEPFMIQKSLSRGAFGFVRKEVNLKDLEIGLVKILKDHMFLTN